MKTVELPSGERVPTLGLGTWHMAERAVTRGEEIAALQHGVDQGASLIDTAEMYADGGAGRLQAAGKIRHWGVSNLDGADVQELLGAPAGDRCSVNQVLYNLSARGIEWDLEPLCRRRGIPIMAYSPLDQGRLLKHRGLLELAASIGLTAAQLALAWTIRRDQVITIPKAATRRHLDEILAARNVELGPDVVGALDRLFEPPTGPEPLAML
jgi:diketogulonate reductase-like aldo/keto reductase